MRRNYNQQGLSVRHYQYFACFTLGLGVLAGLSGDGFSPQVAAAAPAEYKQALAVKPSGLVGQPAPLSPFVEEEASEPSAEAPAAVPDLAALSDPAKTPVGTAGTKPVLTSKGGPNPGQIDRLVAASRERSGSMDQGDEPSLAS